MVDPSAGVSSGLMCEMYVAEGADHGAGGPRTMGVTRAEVPAWSAGTKPPGATGMTALRTYLEVDERQLHGLVLRSQTHLVQARIRN